MFFPPIEPRSASISVISSVAGAAAARTLRPMLPLSGVYGQVALGAGRCSGVIALGVSAVGSTQ